MRRLRGPRNQRIRVNVGGHIAGPHDQILAQVQLRSQLSYGQLPCCDYLWACTLLEPQRQPFPAGQRLGGIKQFKETPRPEYVQIDGVRMLPVQEFDPGRPFPNPVTGEAVKSSFVKFRHSACRGPFFLNTIMEHSADEYSGKYTADEKCDWNDVSQQHRRDREGQPQKHPQIAGPSVLHLIMLKPLAPSR